MFEKVMEKHEVLGTCIAIVGIVLFILRITLGSKKNLKTEVAKLKNIFEKIRKV